MNQTRLVICVLRGWSLSAATGSSLVKVVKSVHQRHQYISNCNFICWCYLSPPPICPWRRIFLVKLMNQTRLLVYDVRGWSLSGAAGSLQFKESKLAGTTKTPSSFKPWLSLLILMEPSLPTCPWRIFFWKSQWIELVLCLCCKVLSTLRFSWLSTVLRVEVNQLKTLSSS